MRLERKYSNAIAALAAEIFSPLIGIKLFGSRVDDAKRGGDIDLLVIVSADHLAVARSRKFEFLDQIQGIIGEQRIDIVIASQEQLIEDEFLRNIECVDLNVPGSIFDASKMDI